MKRALIGLVVAGAALISTPHASAEVVYCGITPRYPCGWCEYDPTTNERKCIMLREAIGS